MFGRNVDFTAVLFITLMMLGLGWVRSLHWTESIDSIRIENAIRVERCPLTRDILSSLTTFLHR
jgi:hypothetical protein